MINKPVFNKPIQLFCLSMGKVFEVKFITDTEKESNTVMQRNRDVCLIAVDSAGRHYLAEQYGSIAPSAIMRYLKPDPELTKQIKVVKRRIATYNARIDQYTQQFYDLRRHDPNQNESDYYNYGTCPKCDHIADKLHGLRMNIQGAITELAQLKAKLRK